MEWELINLYKDGIMITNTYRKNLIKNIRNNFTQDDFFLLEQKIEKMFWDIKRKINMQTEYQEFDNIKRAKLELKKDIYYRSFINKIINIDDKNNKVYYHKMEGSANIFSQNKENVIAMTILFDKNLYEKLMNNKLNPNNIEVPKYYLQQNYGFPNINYCKYNICSDKYRKEKIYKMFYCDDCEKNWYKIIE